MENSLSTDNLTSYEEILHEAMKQAIKEVILEPIVHEIARQAVETAIKKMREDIKVGVRDRWGRLK